MGMTVSEAWELSRADSGLAVVSTVRADHSVQASLVNTGIVGDRLGFVTYGRVKLANLRARPQLAVTFRAGWRWATVEGRAELAGPDDPRAGLDEEGLRLLLREIFSAAGGTHDDWDEYDRVMREQRRTAVLVTPERVYGS
jgi:PPOX class probable F420-dependent enzyme